MPRGVPKDATENGAVNKSELIRTTAKSMGKDVRPRDIVAALKEQGVTVASPMVSKILKKLGLRRKGVATKSDGGKKDAAAAHGAAEPSKAQRIRDAAAALGKKVRPRDVIAELAKEGITVSAAQVSMTLTASGYRRKRRRGKAAKVTTVKPTSTNGLNVDALLAAKALIAKVGSVEVAEEALAALKKLA